MGYCKRCGPLLVFTDQENVSEGCACLMSEVGVAALCVCVSCGLWVPLMWSVCGRELPWILQPVFTECLRVFNERSGRSSSLWVCLLWSVGASDVVSVWA